MGHKGTLFLMNRPTATRHFNTSRQLERWAALDLGSNNFQMLLVEVDHGELRVVDRLKDKVQLLHGFCDGQLDSQALHRGREALGRYAQLLRSVPTSRVHAKGTYALRAATNSRQFLQDARDILGVPIDVISGDEEARLIDLAVSRHLGRFVAQDAHTCLVIDIGGGSTEFAQSRQKGINREMADCLSLPLGCVSLSDAFFGKPELVAAVWKRARAAALDACADVLPRFRGADLVVGTSGILESILTVCEANGFSHGAVTRLAVLEIERALSGGLWVADLGLPGLPPERTDIFPAGVAILSAIMEVLRIERIHFSDATLPHGMLYDAMGLGPDPEPQTAAVAALMSRFGVEPDQAERVRSCALGLVKGCGVVLDQRHVGLLSHAAGLHEIGLSLGVQGYHRHGAYLLQNTPVRGFCPDDQQALAWLIRSHRRAFPHAAKSMGERVQYPHLDCLLIALRLAVIIERGRCPAQSSGALMRMTDRRIDLTVGAAWRAANTLSMRGLEEEKLLLARQGYELVIR
jgi:exopolyphosphatase / guanosine-5'-triphosphate,3'-diphosphate pyrophosphatase